MLASKSPLLESLPQRGSISAAVLRAVAEAEAHARVRIWARAEKERKLGQTSCQNLGMFDESYLHQDLGTLYIPN